MNNAVQDHPDIRNAERTGYPNPAQAKYEDGTLKCPICGTYIFDDYDVYVDKKDGTIAGCEVCKSKTNAHQAYLDGKIQLEE